MAFQTGLSGLNAASRNLDVIGHNIANANTVGMKSSRAEFSELVASSIGVAGNGSFGAGLGVSVAAVSQQFTQGNLNLTGNNLDVAINGSGFFQLSQSDGSAAYTRDGQFKLDKSGYLVTNTGANVMGYPTDTAGVTTSITPQKMSVPSGAPIPAKATGAITAEFNLDARAPLAASVTPPTPLTTYGTSLTAYDSQGVEVPVSLYFQKVAASVPIATGATDAWDVFDSATAATPIFQMQFDATGKLASPTAAQSITLTSTNAAIAPFTASLDLSKATQYGTSFAVSNLTQDGYTAGNLTGLTIGADGVITTRYSNGQTQAQGQLSLVNFRNVQGLNDSGGGNWIQTYASGDPVQGSPGNGSFGLLTAGALEESNVDLTAELVNMMTAQRAYQANAQTIKTQDQAMQTLVNLR
jgi:flagellar hook protein FlgE